METTEHPVRSDPWAGPLALAVGLVVALVALAVGGVLLGILFLFAAVCAACLVSPRCEPAGARPPEPASAAA